MTMMATAATRLPPWGRGRQALRRGQDCWFEAGGARRGAAPYVPPVMWRELLSKRRDLSIPIIIHGSREGL